MQQIISCSYDILSRLPLSVEIGNNTKVLIYSGNTTEREKKMYLKKTMAYEAFQFDGDFISSDGKPYVPDWAIEAHKAGKIYFGSLFPETPPCELFVKTAKGDVHVDNGDYVIRDVFGELSACKKELFGRIYQEQKGA